MDEDVQGAWDFASHVGGTDALLGQWGGLKKHEQLVEGDLEGAGADLPHSGITQKGTSGQWKRKRADVHSDEHIKVPKVVTNGVLTTASGQVTNGNQSRLDQWLDCIQGPDCPQEAQIGRHAKVL